MSPRARRILCPNFRRSIELEGRIRIMRQGSESDKSNQQPPEQAPTDAAAQSQQSSSRKSGGLTSWRSAHRSRNHDSAHAEDLMAHDSRVIDHPMIPPGAAPLIDDQPGLDRLIDEF